jgi:hypothetical protein
MIHQPLGGAQGQAADIEIQANEIMVRFGSQASSQTCLFPLNSFTQTHYSITNQL